MTTPDPNRLTAASWAWVCWVRSLDPETACGALADITPAQRHASDVDYLVRRSWGLPAREPSRWWAPPRLLAQPLVPPGSPPCPAAEQRGQIHSWRCIAWVPTWMPDEQLEEAYTAVFATAPERDSQNRALFTGREVAACLRHLGALPEQEVRA